MEQTERLKLIREALRLSAPEFAAKLGYFNAGSYRNIENGADDITEKFIFRLQKAVPDINMDWFVSGKGEILTPQDKANNINNPIENNTKLIPTIMTDQTILSEFFDALKRKDEQINRLINLQEKLFNKFETRGEE